MADFGAKFLTNQQKVPVKQGGFGPLLSEIAVLAPPKPPLKHEGMPPKTLWGGLILHEGIPGKTYRTEGIFLLDVTSNLSSCLLMERDLSLADPPNSSG